MHHLTVTLTTVNGRITPDKFTGHDLLGLSYHLAQRVDEAEAAWLHDKQRDPKPFSVAPIWVDGMFTGVRFGIVSDRAAVLLQRAWEGGLKAGKPWRLGRAKLVISYVECRSGLGFAEMLAQPPADTVTLHFRSPTTFGQSDMPNDKAGYLLLPLPGNVFSHPYRVWQQFAPPPMKLPQALQTWYTDSVLVSRHEIATDTFSINRHSTFPGFVGTATFLAMDDNKEYRTFWRALAQLAPYSGVGAKTAYGLGAVDFGSSYS